VSKTHVARSLGQPVIRAGYDVRFVKASRALAHLSGGHADGSWSKRPAELARSAVLILDDWAMRELKAVQADDLYEPAGERAVARKPLDIEMVTSRSMPSGDQAKHGSRPGASERDR
jgi:DNA replication protein DnaC